MSDTVSEILSYPSKFVDVFGSKMHYVEAGQGDPILLLHGIPTSCYVWRNIIPHLASLGRCIAPDLIGFGRSDKPDIEYTVFDHIKYIDKFIETLGLKRITIVMHGWGSVIGFDYAMRNEKNCLGLAFYEAFLRSSDVSLPCQEQLLSYQDQDDLYDIAMNGSAFVDKIIPQAVMRELSEEEMRQYRQPFSQNGSGKPITQYLRELPTGESVTEVDNLIDAYSEKLVASFIPKLLLYTLPGFITNMSSVMWAKEYLHNLEIAEVGEELHLAQESYPELMGEMISVWLQSINQ